MSEGSGRIRCRSWRNQSEKGGKRSLLWKIPLPSYTGRVLVLACLVSAKRSGAEVRSVSRVYHSACLERGQSYWDYENFQLNSVDWEDVDRYEVTGRLGFGRFSETSETISATSSARFVPVGHNRVREVLEGVTVDERRRKVVLKVLKPARSYKLKREIRVLQLLTGGPNILVLEGVCRDRTTGTTTLVLEHIGDGVQWLGHTTVAALPSPTIPAAASAGGGGAGIQASPGGAGTVDAGGVASAAADVVTSADKRVLSLTSTNSNGDEKVASGAGVTPAESRRDAAVEGSSDGQHHQEARGNDPCTGNPGEASASDGTSTAIDKGRLTQYEIRLYLYKLLQALDYAHSRGLMHRDVKPRNVVINRRTRSLRLIDWGLGDFYIPGRRNMSRVGSRYYKAPELLVGFRFYDYAVDIFSVGCILAGFLLNREPFFRGKDNEDQLLRIALVLGTQGLHDFLRKYDITLEPRILDMLGSHRKKPWSTIGGGSGSSGVDGSPECCQEGLDLLDRMLCYDHQDRISAREAMSHSFFDPVREEAEATTSGSPRDRVP